MIEHQNDMKNRFELLAPGGDVESIKAAIIAGADAVYCGLDSFNARNRAKNISFDELNGVIRVAHTHACKIFLTLNIIILEHEIPALIRLLDRIVNTRIDGVIVQDLGLFHLLSKHYSSLDIHASTQVTTHNEGQIHFLSKLGASRFNLSRELNIDEIKFLTKMGHSRGILSEVFVHGSNCIGFSGLCYISSAHGGNSGNRGRCSQPCRDKYQTTRVGVDYPLNLKDNSAFSDIDALSDAGVDSLKIEGRVKKPHYVFTVVDSWRKQIDNFQKGMEVSLNKTNLYKVFNRDFSSGYLRNNINKNMFIDNPRDNSAAHFVHLKNKSTPEEIQSIKQALYDEKTDIIHSVNRKIEHLCISKIPLTLRFSGAPNEPLRVTTEGPDVSFSVNSESKLISSDKYAIDAHSIEKRFKGFDSADYYIEHLDTSDLLTAAFIPFKELTNIKNQILFILNGSVKRTPPAIIPKLKRFSAKKSKPSISVLISSINDLSLCHDTSVKTYFQLPDCIQQNLSHLVTLFLNNPTLTPWFPSILIGDDYSASIEFLKHVQPETIITNNTGVAYEAYKRGIKWIAGPHLNITNSFSLLCIKEKYNCSGSFISNEISKLQMRQIVCPDDFTLHYSIYHPILLLSSRQCLFHQTTGCKKESVDEECLPTCRKSSSLINLKDTTFFLNKERGEHNAMYSGANFLNTDIPSDLPNTFSSFLVDLRDIKTHTKLRADKAEIVRLFKDLLEGVEHSKSILRETIHPSTNAQYLKGL